VWAVLVFDGNEVEFAPELHDSRPRATEAGRRWAWILASNGEIPIRQRGDSEWIAGFRQVIVATVQSPLLAPHDPWIGLAWDAGCYPAPRVEVVDGLQEAADWVGSVAGPTELLISPWVVASSHAAPRSSRRAAASRAKVVSG
jgi:hypothetical protein